MYLGCGVSVSTEKVSIVVEILERVLSKKTELEGFV